MSSSQEMAEIYSGFLLKLAESNECFNIFKKKSNKYVLASKGISTIISGQMVKMDNWDSLSKYVHKMMFISPITNSNTLIKNIGNFFFYEDFISRSVLKEIQDLQNVMKDTKNKAPICKNEKIIKHTLRGKMVRENMQCSEFEEDSFIDSNFHKMIKILESNNIDIFNLKINQKSQIYPCSFFWPQRSIKVSFLNKIFNFLGFENKKFEKISYDNEITKLIPVDYYLNDVLNSLEIPKIHIFITEDFNFSNPFNFYNFVNYEIFNIKFRVSK